VLPGEPSYLLAIRTQARRRIKIGASGEHDWALLCAEIGIEIDCDQRRHRLAAPAMVLTDRDQALARGVKYQISKALSGGDDNIRSIAVCV
jgi:hypothetical protein